ncbi:MAG: histidine phosphatase family protein [Candidatus Aenigmarchaeota archaeon]|nr:histidine phosphatase family protein [Candidatus Aenigmarchaeota archaeon]
MVVRLILVRHGETDWNVKGLIQGDSNRSRLTVKGKNQCRKLRPKIAKLEIAAVYASPLQRALETARLISPAGRPIRARNELRERHFGRVEGKSFAAFIRGNRKRWAEWSRSRELPDVPGVETIPRLQQRAMRAVLGIAKRQRNKNILIVTHGAFIRYLIARVLKLPLPKVSEINPANCSVNVIEINSAITERNMRVVAVNGRRLRPGLRRRG